MLTPPTGEPHSELREALTHAKVLVSELYPQMRQAVVGCFIFLRFFCPAIVSPHTAGIIDCTSSERASCHSSLRQTHTHSSFL